MPSDSPQPRTIALPRRGVTGVPAHLLIAGVSALLLGLAFPEPGLGWVAHLALVPVVILALRSTSARRLAWTVYLVSLTWWLARLSWLTGVTVGGYVALCLYMAVYLPGAMLLVRWLDRKFRGAMTLLLPMAWVSLEFLRGYVLAGGFGWFALGHTQAAYAPGQAPGLLVQSASLGGEWTVSFLVAMTNGLIVDLLNRPLVHRKRSGQKRWSKTVTGAVLLWVLTYTVALGYGWWCLRTTPRGTPTLRVTVVQSNQPQDNKISPTAESIAADWRALVDLTLRAAEESAGADLIVWPETVVPAATNPEATRAYEAAGSGATFFDRELRALARGLGVHLLVGGHAETPDGRRWNSAFLYLPDGTLWPRWYDKMHRVPFGEYIPWVEDWPWLKGLFMKYLSPYAFDYTIQPGTERTLFTVGPARLATPICFEDALARACRPMVYDQDGKKRVEMLVNLTNDGWYPGTDQNPQHVQIAALRCIENRVPMARSVNTGISGFIDSVGRVGPVVEVGGRRQRVAGHVTADVAFDPRTTLFARVRQWPIILTALATALLTAAGVMKKDKPR